MRINESLVSNLVAKEMGTHISTRFWKTLNLFVGFVCVTFMHDLPLVLPCTKMVFALVKCDFVYLLAVSLLQRQAQIPWLSQAEINEMNFLCCSFFFPFRNVVYLYLKEKGEKEITARLSLQQLVRSPVSICKTSNCLNKGI